MGNKDLTKRCVIIAGSPDCSPNFLSETVVESDYVICADKGYKYALCAGIKPDLFVGDCDSFSDSISSELSSIRLDVHKDDSDTAHSVDYALENDFKNIIILGAVGGRIDHTLANICILQHISYNGGRGELISENEKILFLKTGHYDFENLIGLTFSLFPFGCKNAFVSIGGAEYPLNKAVLASDVTLGLSNVFISNKAFVDVYDGNAIIIINLKDV